MQINNELFKNKKIKVYPDDSYFGFIIDGNGCKNIPEFNTDFLNLLYESGFIILRNFEVKEKQVLDWFLNLAEPINYSFGNVLSMQPKVNSSESQFSNKAMSIHQDTIINDSKKANLLSFYCVDAPSKGGESLLCSNRMFLKSIDKQLYNTLKNSTIFYKANKTDYYKGNGEATQKPIVNHPSTGEEILFMGLNDSSDIERNFISYFEDMSYDRSENLMKEIDVYFRKPEVMYQHVWKNGDILLLDNFLVSHGRNSFDKASKRKLLRVSSIVDYNSETFSDKKNSSIYQIPIGFGF